MFAFIVLLLCITYSVGAGQDNPKPTISFSFDDGSTKDYPGYSNSDWNRRLLQTLTDYQIDATLYVKGVALDNKIGHDIIKSWSEAGHAIGNHTYNHPYFNSPKVYAADMISELKRTDSLIRDYENYQKIFRFPYLKEGENETERDSFRLFMDGAGYTNGYVTIDASDWYVDSRLVKRIKEDSNANLDRYKDYYISHIYDRAVYYEELAYDMTGRHIYHTLLLHHNLAASLFLDDLIELFTSMGWKVIGQKEALKDPI